MEARSKRGTWIVPNQEEKGQVGEMVTDGPSAEVLSDDIQAGEMDTHFEEVELNFAKTCFRINLVSLRTQSDADLDTDIHSQQAGGVQSGRTVSDTEEDMTDDETKKQSAMTSRTPADSLTSAPDRISSVCDKIDKEAEQLLNYEEKEQEAEPGSDEEKDVAQPGSDEEKEVAQPGSDEVKEVAHPESDEEKEVAHPESDEEKEAAQPGSDEEKEVAHPVSDEEKEVAHPASDEEKEVAQLENDEEKGIAYPGSDEEKELVHTGNDEEKEVAHPERDTAKEVAQPGSYEEKEVAQAGSDEEKETVQSGSDEEKEVAQAGSDEEKEVAHSGSDEEKEAAHPGSAGENEVAHPDSDELDYEALMALFNSQSDLIRQLHEDLGIDLTEEDGGNLTDDDEESELGSSLDLGDYEECQICMDIGRDVSLRPCCQFKVCRTCFSTYLYTKVFEGMVVQIECPNFNCHKQLGEYEISGYLDHDTKMKYHKFITDAQIDSTEKSCPRCGLEQHVDRKVLKKKTTIKKGLPVTCQACALHWCFSCHAPWHEGVTCKEYQQGDEEFRKWTREGDLLQVNAQKCPMCKVYIQRSSGCPHMTCPRCCTSFCYSCGGRFYPARRYHRAFNSRAFRVLLGNHHSRLGIMGCRHNFLPKANAARRLIRGSVLGAKLVGGACALAIGVGVAAVGVVVVPVVWGTVKVRRKVKQRRNRRR